MSNKTRIQLITTNNANISDNSTQDITPAKLRGVVQDLIDSAANLSDDALHTGTVASDEIAAGTVSNGLKTSPRLKVEAAPGAGSESNIIVAVPLDSADGYAGLRTGTDFDNCGAIYSFGSLPAGNYYSGTSIDKSNTLFINARNGQQDGNGSIYRNGKFIYDVGAVYGWRLDDRGARLAAKGTLHTSNSKLFEAGPLTIDSSIIYSGGTNLASIFAPASHTHSQSDVTGLSAALATKANLSGASFTGVISSGGTDLSNLFALPKLQPMRIAFGNGSSALTTNSQLYYDNTNAAYNDLWTKGPNGNQYVRMYADNSSSTLEGSTLTVNGQNGLYVTANGNGADIRVYAGGGSTTAGIKVEKGNVRIVANGSTSDFNNTNNSSSAFIVGGGGRSFFGANSGATAYVDILSASTGTTSLRIRSGSTVTSPNDGDIWNDGGNLVARVGGQTTQLNNSAISPQIATKANLSGATFTGNVDVSAGNRLMSGGTDLYNIFGTSSGVSTSTNIRVFNGNTLQSASFTDYVFNGSSANLALLALASFTNKKVYVYNAGSGTLNINSNAGGNDIYDFGTGSAVSTIAASPNDVYMLTCDGTFYYTKRL